MCSSIVEELSWWHKRSHLPIHISTCETAEERFNRPPLTNILQMYRAKYLHRAKPSSPFSSSLQTRLSAKWKKPKTFKTPLRKKAVLSVCTDIIYRFVGQAAKHKACNYAPPPINNSFSKPHYVVCTVLLGTQRSTVIRSEGCHSLCPTQNLSRDQHVEHCEAT